jgi:hypothetical protein
MTQTPQDKLVSAASELGRHIDKAYLTVTGEEHSALMSSLVEARERLDARIMDVLMATREETRNEYRAGDDGAFY